jgi:hypothetical protein
MKIVLTNEEKLQYFHSALCNGLVYLGGYGLELDYNTKDYIEISEQLKTENPNVTICHEDVLIEMIKRGKNIRFVDNECDGEYNVVIGLDEVLKNIEKTPVRNLLNIHEETDDAEDADAILQSVAYGEIIFG